MVVHNICKILHGLKPIMVMVLVQAIFAGVNVFYKLATRDGTNMRILVAYRFIFATIFLSPIAYFVERNKRLRMTWIIMFQLFLSGLLGGMLAQYLYLLALSFTSMTFAAAMTNLIPGITFIIAVLLRMERLGIHTAAGIAKLVGTSICIGGAMVLTFYKGPEVIFWSTNIDLTRGLGNGTSKSGPQASNMALGLVIALGCCLCYSFWLIVQAKMSKTYPCHLSSTALMCLMGSIQSVIFVMCVDHKWEEWKLGWNIRLLSAAYAGILASGMMFTLISWGVKARGPLFVSIFSPLTLLMVAIMGSLFLGEKLHVGSLVGAVLIVVGLYSVLWGKGKEAKRMTPQLKPSKSSKDAECIEVVATTKPFSSLAITGVNNNNNNDNLSSTVLPKLATVTSAATSF